MHVRSSGVADYKKLKVWQKAHGAAVNIHNACARIRSKDHSHLKAQLLRAAFSVPANIVEGSGKQSQREFSRYLRIALNSATEVEYHLIAARDTEALGNETVKTLLNQIIEVRKMLHGLIEAVESNPD